MSVKKEAAKRETLCTVCGQKMYPNLRGSGANREIVMMCVDNQNHQAHLLCDHEKMLKERRSQTEKNKNKIYWSCYKSYHENPCKWENKSGQKIWLWEEEVLKIFESAKQARMGQNVNAQRQRSAKRYKDSVCDMSASEMSDSIANFAMGLKKDKKCGDSSSYASSSADPCSRDSSLSSRLNQSESTLAMSAGHSHENYNKKTSGKTDRPRIPEYRKPQPKNVKPRIPDYKPPTVKFQSPKKHLTNKTIPMRPSKSETSQKIIESEMSPDEKFIEVRKWALTASIDSLKVERENNYREMLKVQDEKLRLHEKIDEIFLERLKNLVKE